MVRSDSGNKELEIDLPYKPDVD